MNYLEAKEVLKLQSGGAENNNTYLNDKQNFLCSSLHEFNGELINDNVFQNIKIAIHSVYVHFKGEEKVDRDIIKYIYWIIIELEYQAIREGSHLRRKNLISETQLNVLRKWKNDYCWMLNDLLQDFDPNLQEN